jgi:PPOX class probable F420-dependent enzyme
MDGHPILPESRRERLSGARRAVLATIAPDGRARLVPVCFVLDPDLPVLYSPLDEKPKGIADVRDLARVRDIVRDARVTVLVDGWDEDWERLWWLRLDGAASLVEPGGKGAEDHRVAVAALRSKYLQYATHDLAGRPIIRIQLEHVTGWAAAQGEAT